MLRFIKEIQGTRNSDNYATPKKFYNQLNDEFNFDFDPCPLKAEFNGLEIDWKGNIFCNPPYSNIKPFIQKGIDEIQSGNAKTVVYLIPIRSDTGYWHDLILPNAKEIRYVRGRLNFNESKHPAPFPVVLVIFRNSPNDGEDVLVVNTNIVQVATYSSHDKVIDRSECWFNWDTSKWINNSHIKKWINIPTNLFS